VLRGAGAEATCDPGRPREPRTCCRPFTQHRRTPALRVALIELAAAALSFGDDPEPPVRHTQPAAAGRAAAKRREATTPCSGVIATPAVAQLRPTRPVLDSRRLRARGSLAPVARGRVVLRVSFLAGGAYHAHRARARIERGRYRANVQLPSALRAWLARREGAVRVTTTFPGRAARGVHGEQRIATATIR
jgi:hypothetical protein